MPFKVNRPGPTVSALSGFTLLDVQGPGAEGFLQAQLMNDVSALTPGRWQWNGWLTPKGRVISLFALARMSAETFLIVLPDHPADELRNALQRFVFRAKVTLTVRDGWRCAAGYDVSFDPAAPARDSLAGTEESGWAMDWSGDGQKGRCLFLLPETDGALAPLGPADEAIDARWLADDLAHGLPRLPASQSEAWTPQMLSLDRLKAFSLKKGCYPGQEIVARTHYLGQAKRGLIRVGGTGLAGGTTVLDGENRSLGTVVCTTADRSQGLAVVTLGEETTLFGPENAPMNRLELLPGLERPV
ncbi:hypothetical protein N789_12240 [Arenimonas oryziterrae DSM 21050 = YC6267]|uniref:GCVT N-terminal domain-containing protein n=2 Tax=Arenimonas TaxID=490567 RepID=A0A091AUI5_9GAMM|nr:folate-binding protein YgfZ [Arenimonas oryziterrae]KFN42892.1 hypothetical protein N789_12240 [Arenimonas oryziterrae DSM 21050 = YC6267]